MCVCVCVCVFMCACVYIYQVFAYEVTVLKFLNRFVNLTEFMDIQ